MKWYIWWWWYIWLNVHETNNVNSWHFWCHEFAVISPSICCNAFPMVPCTLPAFFIMNLQTLQLYYPFNDMIYLCNFVLQLVEAAICFTICMTQCVFSILIYSFNHMRDVLAPIYMPVSSEDKWKSIADEFYEIWNFLNCMGAIKGKNIMIQYPKFTGWLSADWPEMSNEKMSPCCLKRWSAIWHFQCLTSWLPMLQV